MNQTSECFNLSIDAVVASSVAGSLEAEGLAVYLKCLFVEISLEVLTKQFNTLLNTNNEDASLKLYTKCLHVGERK